MERQPDMNVVEEVIDLIELIFALRVIPADIIIITLHKANRTSGICGQLLNEHTQ